jgi:hypothetical protein
MAGTARFRSLLQCTSIYRDYYHVYCCYRLQHFSLAFKVCTVCGEHSGSTQGGSLSSRRDGLEAVAKTWSPRAHLKPGRPSRPGRGGIIIQKTLGNDRNCRITSTCSFWCLESSSPHWSGLGGSRSTSRSGRANNNAMTTIHSTRARQDVP